MIPNKKYQKSIITHFTKRKIIIRKGGYFPRRLYFAATLLGLLVASFVLAIVFNVLLGALYLFPAILAAAGIKQFYKNHVFFGETIHIQRNRIFLQLTGSNKKKIQFRKDTIKSMTCIIIGDYYQFKIYKRDNSSMSFSVRDTKQQRPLQAILKFTNLSQRIENTQGDKKVIRSWSKKSNLKKKPREIKNISEKFYEYRSPYFTIEIEDERLKVEIKNHLYQSLVIDKENRIIEYFDQFDEKQSIKFNEIVSIEKVLFESAPLKSNNRITVSLKATLKNGNTTDLLVCKTHEPIPGEMEIFEIDKDFENLTSIVDMNIKSVIDEDLEVLDLEELKEEHRIKLKSPLEDRNL